MDSTQTYRLIAAAVFAALMTLGIFSVAHQGAAGLAPVATASTSSAP
jgi:hypothetical protein